MMCTDCLMGTNVARDIHRCGMIFISSHHILLCPSTKIMGKLQTISHEGLEKRRMEIQPAACMAEFMILDADDTLCTPLPISMAPEGCEMP